MKNLLWEEQKILSKKIKQLIVFMIISILLSVITLLYIERYENDYLYLIWALILLAIVLTFGFKLISYINRFHKSVCNNEYLINNYEDYILKLAEEDLKKENIKCNLIWTSNKKIYYKRPEVKDDYYSFLEIKSEEKQQRLMLLYINKRKSKVYIFINNDKQIIKYVRKNLL